MLNFRKLRKDLAPSVLKEGKDVYSQGAVLSVKISEYANESMRLACKVQGSFENTYECEIEIDKTENTVSDSNCDCPNSYDCQHMAAVLFHLEDHLDELLEEYASHNTGKVEALEESEQLNKEIEKARSKVTKKKSLFYEKETLEEYTSSSLLLGTFPLFIKEEKPKPDEAELLITLFPSENQSGCTYQIALRLPYRSKPLLIAELKAFFDSYTYKEPIYINSRRYFFTSNSFSEISQKVLDELIRITSFQHAPEQEKESKLGWVDHRNLGEILYTTFYGKEQQKPLGTDQSPPSFFLHSYETPLHLAKSQAKITVEIDYIETPSPKILLNPALFIEEEKVSLEEAKLLGCQHSAVLHKNGYFLFDSKIKRKHLLRLPSLRDITIPEPLFGTFIEYSLPELKRYAEVLNEEKIQSIITLPPMEELQAECDLSYLEGELEAKLHFIYDEIKVPYGTKELTLEVTDQFLTKRGILARHLAEEQNIVQDLFQDFFFNEETQSFVTRSDKKVVEFMTEVLPRNQMRVQFICPENLLQQFIYDETTVALAFNASDKMDSYELKVEVVGALEGLHLNTLWECISAKKAYIELGGKESTRARKKEQNPMLRTKFLVLDLEKLSMLVQVLDELGVSEVKTQTLYRPLWSVTSIDEKMLQNLEIPYTISPKLEAIRSQILGQNTLEETEIPQEIQAKLRSYQIDGVSWLERLRKMYLGGILADDMGLGKTLQAICTLTQFHKENPEYTSVIVCPTSLVYNWKEEIHKFNPELQVQIVDGTPQQRKKLLKPASKPHIYVTSYTLLQKDVEEYHKLKIGYVILDEAQHIKNRATRNAKSVKELPACHKLILTGTPIENSLDELWSLFDFLMPGLLSSYERFVERYLKCPQEKREENLKRLKEKVSPFILRRMKKEVLNDLPDVSEIVYHCHLSEMQQKLYREYAESAKRELSQLVEKEGFEKVQIHVLATLTRLKQICCHPAIIAKEKVEEGDSAKYEMLMDLVENLRRGGHKTVVFSQYTKMLQIISKDFKKKGIKFEYLDGTTKNRMEIVNRFNADADISVFLVSLKAGGVGLNLVGADSVIHYDMWWNPAVESQATDRVHRIGQKKNVSCYKLVTLNSIEEKILELQNRKKGLVKHVVSTDEEAISKLTWEEVLELLQM